MNSTPFSLRPKSSYLTLLNRATIYYRLKIGIFESKRKFPFFLPSFLSYLVTLFTTFFSLRRIARTIYTSPLTRERFYGTCILANDRLPFMIFTIYIFPPSYILRDIDEDNNIMFPDERDIFVFTFPFQRNVRIRDLVYGQRKQRSLLSRTRAKR